MVDLPGLNDKLCHVNLSKDMENINELLMMNKLKLNGNKTKLLEIKKKMEKLPQASWYCVGLFEVKPVSCTRPEIKTKYGAYPKVERRTLHFLTQLPKVQLLQCTRARSPRGANAQSELGCNKVVVRVDVWT